MDRAPLPIVRRELHTDPILRGLKHWHDDGTSRGVYITYWPDFKGIETSFGHI